MPVPFQTFRPADYHKGKESYISFYVTDPSTHKLTRRKIKLNHIRKTTDRDKYARLLCHQINEKLFAGWNPIVEESGGKSITLAKAVEKFLAMKKKSCRTATMRSYSSYSRIFLQWAENNRLSESYCMLISKDHLLAFLETTSGSANLSNRSWNNYAGFLYTLFDFFVMRGWMKTNPADKLPKMRVDRKNRTVIPKAERALIMDYFLQKCPRYAAVMQLCFRLFIRPKEITMLRICDIDFDNRLLRITSDVAKNHCERVLGIPDVIMDYFLTLRDLPASWYIFADRNTYAPGPHRIYPTRIAERWKEMRDELKLPASYQFYSLKDTGITEMLEAGVPPKYVKELADHHSLEMTERYTHRSEAKKILEWNRLEF